MNFRTITSSIELKYGFTELEIDKQLTKINSQLEIIKKKYKNIKTIRISIIFNEKLSIADLPSLINTLNYLKLICSRKNIRWFSLALNSSQFENIDNISEIVTTIIRKISNIFIHLIVDEKSEKIFDAYSKTIIKVSRISESGFDNFRLGISDGNTFNTPFFPFSNFKDPLTFSVGLETLETLIKELYKKDNINYSDNLKKYKNKLIKNLNSIDSYLSKNSIISYSGIDASLAPIPRTNQSIGLLFELLGVHSLGNLGTLSVTSKLTSLIKNAFRLSNAKSAGFNGVMFSPLEDDWLAKQSYNNTLTPESLMLYSSVCGCGIDMVPLPGDIFIETISCLICDVINLSQKHKKPLGIRILPIPGKFSNEKTSFNHDFLSDMKIINIKDSIMPNLNF